MLFPPLTFEFRLIFQPEIKWRDKKTFHLDQLQVCMIFTCNICYFLYLFIPHTKFITAERHTVLLLTAAPAFAAFYMKRLGALNYRMYLFVPVPSGSLPFLKSDAYFKLKLTRKQVYIISIVIGLSGGVLKNGPCFPLFSPQVLGLCRSSTRGRGTVFLWLLLPLRMSSSSTVNSRPAPAQLHLPAHHVNDEQNENWQQKLFKFKVSHIEKNMSSALVKSWYLKKCTSHLVLQSILYKW